MKTTKRYLKKIDLFGHSINFNLGGENESFKTNIGGIFTIFLGIFMLYLIYTNADNNNAQITIDIEKLDTEKAGEHSYKKSNMMVFFTIRKQVGVLPVWF